MKEEGDNKEKEVKRGKGGWYIGGVWWGDKGVKRGQILKEEEKRIPHMWWCSYHIPHKES